MAIKKPIKPPVKPVRPPEENTLQAWAEIIGGMGKIRQVTDEGHSAALTCVHGIQLHKPCPWCPKRSLTLSFPVVEWEGELWALVQTHCLTDDPVDGFSITLRRAGTDDRRVDVTEAEFGEICTAEWGEFSFTGYVPKPEE